MAADLPWQLEVQEGISEEQQIENIRDKIFRNKTTDPKKLEQKSHESRRDDEKENPEESPRREELRGTEPA